MSCGRALSVAGRRVTRAVKLLVPSCLAWLAICGPLFAQAPAAPSDPPRPWAGSVAAGVSLTGGNTDTLTTNLAFEMQSDRTKRNVFKADGLNLRSSQEGSSIVDRTNLSARDEFGLNARTYVLGQLQYLRDVFKSIDYLMAPTVGVGLRLFNTPAISWSVDTSIGGVVEKNPGRDRTSSGAVNLAEKLSYRLSSTATITQAVTALWKTEDSADALYTFGAGIASSITSRTQIKVEFLDTFKNKPPSIFVQKNDTALMTSLALKF